MAELKPGNPAPDFHAPDHESNDVGLSDFAGRKRFVFFYPKAGTSGCATQVQAVRDALPDLTAAGVAVIGISPDKPAAQKKFHDKHDLGYPLLSDPGHQIAEVYGVWGEKKMYGKTYMGIVRSAFLIDEAGNITATGYKISPKNTVPSLMKWLAQG